MLLRHTPKEVVERTALTVNPAKTCQPIGALFAALGIHGCLPHSHGSQGCCAYHRSTLSRHYKEPVMAGTSSFTEGSSVFGGQANLVQAIDNMFSIYGPRVIAIHTTCLSETIGDDIPQIIDKARSDGVIPEGRHVIHANTPSYVGSHVTGFANMAKATIDYLAGATGTKQPGQVAIVPGWVEPADIREIKRLVQMMGLDPLVVPDPSGVLDGPLTGTFEMYPSGGVTVEQLATAGNSAAVIALGQTASAPAGRALTAKHGVPCKVLPLPIGLRGTDRLIQELARVTGAPVPDAVTEERGRLVDLISDMHQYLYGKRVAVWGDPDQLVSLTEFLIDLDMIPAYVITGTPGKKFLKRMAEVLGPMTHATQVREGPQADMFLMHQWIKNQPVDLLLGNTYGKYISRDHDIPFVRHGFPILDRVGHTYFPTAGYRGAMRLVEQILEAFLERQDRLSPEHAVELTM